jgi:hypothetical protein
MFTIAFAAAAAFSLPLCHAFHAAIDFGFTPPPRFDISLLMQFPTP